MERLTVGNKPLPKEGQDQKNRNQNVRRLEVLQNKQKDQRNPHDQPIIPPFQDNYVEQEYGNQGEGDIHQLYTDSSSGFLTKEEHDDSLHEAEELRVEETKNFQRGYQLAVMDL